MSLSSQCRLCLSNDADNVFAFGSMGQKYNLQVKVWKLFCVMMTPEDLLPKCICLACIPKVEMFYNFLLIVRTSQKDIESYQLQLESNSQFGTDSSSVHSPNHNHDLTSQYVQADNKNLIFKSPSSPTSGDNDTDSMKPDTSNVEVIIHESSCSSSSYNQSQATDMKPEGLSLPAVRVGVMSPKPKNINEEDRETNFECFLINEKGGDPLIDSNEYDNRVEHVDVKPSRVLKNVVSRNRMNRNRVIRRRGRPRKAPVKSSASKRKTKKFTGVQIEEPVDNTETAISEIDQRLSDVYDFTCKHCEVKFVTFAKLSRHSREFHFEPAVVLCCGKKMSNVQRLKHHLSKHLPSDDLRCPQCGVDCSSKIHLNLHILSHLPHSLRPFKCTKCHRGYCNNSSLQAHLKSSHNNTYIEAKVCICDECGKSLTSEKKLYNHKNYHHRDTSRVCPNCGKMCRTKGLLNLHLESHKTEIDLKCTECDKMFRTSTAKRHHFNRNHSTAEFMCDICGRIYKSRGDVQKHIFTQHTDKKPEKCKICNKRFKLRSVLRNHMNQHTGELPYPCPHCPKAFTCSGNRTKHKKRIHPDYKQIELELAQLHSHQDM